jgi:hypothetical protein
VRFFQLLFVSAYSLVGDNNNKGTTPNLLLHRRLLLITPTRAVRFFQLLFVSAYSLVGDNNNKGTAPNLLIYRCLLLITPTRARQMFEQGRGEPLCVSAGERIGR